MQDVDLTKFKIHTPKDPSDPGFTIAGVKLRWISGKVRENSGSSHLWVALQKSKLPEKLVAHIESYNLGAFNSGNTYRRGNGELVLAYAPVEQIRKHRVQLDMLNKEQSSRANILPNDKNESHKDFSKVEEYEESAGSIPEAFLNKKTK